MAINEDGKANAAMRCDTAEQSESATHGGKDKPRDENRSLANRPKDPNSATSKGNFPPGVAPEDVSDPGRQTPGAPPVDNRS